ncbi:SLAP domain-containing protein [Lactobacillus delbrueckii]|uniref:SLAP domain-containing protein n=1 Tax=Lactobacillus delbrueckii TaxID=1584 RepID=UPI0006809580|nr:SLAP domain-containing protein [Lactobacillus delbrueckii]APG74086.1 N-acetylmuramoyl-L-alanine amidase [Lactobacillus delbrueckii subsp. sunkii]KNE74823.1 N-acetylmuramoyl-L-alanine amidase [Lactobacillus delbrueckii subsp. sunkii]GHN13100.1 putative amidase [Lactobacillus delbrueckii subsp. sunkii]GHN14091.1 putative amidase [Lactobacillus delbrueckii subsp. sunkii]
MRFRRFFTAAAATVAFGLAFTFGQGQTAQASINSDAKKTTYSGTKSLETLLKAAGLTYNQFNSVANGNKYGSRFGYRNGVGKPEGVVVHETASPGATAWDEGRYFNNNWMTAYTYVHAVVDNNQTIQLMSPDYGVWGAGPIANVRYIQVELCEVSTRSQFVQSVANDAYYIATLLRQYNLTPSRASRSGAGTIWSHNEVSQYLGGTDHGDPDSYFAKWGYSMSDFYSLITYYYNKLGTSSNSGNTNNNTNNSGSSSSSQAPATQPVSTKTVKLMRNSYSYNAYGKKLAVKALKAGSSLKVYGSAITIGSSKYYKYADGKYVKAGNIDGISRTLTGNAWTYTISGSREWSTAKLLKGSKVTTYGSQVKIKGKAYYMTGFTSNNVAKYVKAVNFQPKSVEVSTSKRLMRNSYSYSAAGKKLPDSMLKAGQYLKVYGSAVTIGNAKYYKYGTNKYVKAGNIDGTSRTLTHNAYVYTVKGARNWNEAKRLKGTAVVTYGSRVKLSGKYYYMVGFSGQTALYIKAGNF